MTHIDNMPLYADIAQIIQQAKSAVRSTANSAMVLTYWNIGRLIVEDEQAGENRAQYGKQVLKTLSLKLSNEFGKGFDLSNLKRMRQFYFAFPKGGALRHQFEMTPIKAENLAIPNIHLELSWTHYRHLLKVDSEQARNWYMQQAVQENWSTRALERQINSFYFERILSSKNKAPVISEAQQKTAALTKLDLLKDPYVLEFLQLQNRPEYTENELESALMSELQQFLLELGTGFSFVAKQKHIDLDGEHFYIDLVFYNYKLKCFLWMFWQSYLVLWQMDMYRMYGMSRWHGCQRATTYIRLYEDKFRADDDNPTIGLILCSDKSEALVKYSTLVDHQQLFASKYKLHLPSEEELARELQRELSLFNDLAKDQT